MGSKERQGSRGASEMLRGVVMQAEAIASNTDPVQHLSGNDSRDNATTSGSANGLSEPAIEHAPPPPYSEDYGTVDFNQDGLNTRANVAGTLGGSVIVSRTLSVLQMMVASTSASIKNLASYQIFWHRHSGTN